MISKEEYLAMAAARYAELARLESEESFYDYEKKFDQMWVDLGREVLEASISQVPANHRKKTSFKAATDKSK